MSRVTITIIVPEMEDEEAIALKKEIEELVKEKAGATVRITMAPPYPTMR